MLSIVRPTVTWATRSAAPALCGQRVSDERHAREHGLTVRVWIGRQGGAASTNEFADARSARRRGQAQQLARLSPVDVEYLPTLGPQTYKPTAGYSEDHREPSLRRARAKQIADILLASEKAKVIGAGFHQVRLESRAQASRNGNFIYERSSFVSLGMTARMPDGSARDISAEPCRCEPPRPDADRERSDPEGARIAGRPHHAGRTSIR